MIIVSQGKDELVNFDRIESIWIGADEDGRVTIEATADTNSILGTYSTEERAKEVLKEIIEAYRDYRTAECDGYTNVLQETAVFEMPEE